MPLTHAILLAILEGLTEFLPVSSTGHLVLLSIALEVKRPMLENFAIVLQLGAICAVFAFYRRRVASTAAGMISGEGFGRKLATMLFVAFLPSAAIGLLASDWIEEELFGVEPVAWALLVGGVAMILVEQLLVKRRAARVEALEQGTIVDALAIGLAQCCALWPGMSRSMSTIVGAQLRGFSNAAAAEFSFLLALVTLSAATVYKFLDAYRQFAETEGAMRALLVGNAISFAVAYLSVWFFIKLVNRVGMTPFGIYRIVLGGVLLAYLWLT